MRIERRAGRRAITGRSRAPLANCASSLGMQVNVRVCSGTACFDIDRNQVNLAVAHPALGHDGVGKTLHLARLATQHHGLQTVVVIQMNMHRGQIEVVVRMLDRGEPARDRGSRRNLPLFLGTRIQCL